MKIIQLLTIIILTALLTTSCKQKSKDDYIKITGDYQYPSIPEFIKNTAQERAYFLQHYWDHYPYDDSLFMSKENTEQILVDFLDQSHSIELPQVCSIIQGAIARADKSGPYCAKRLREVFLHYIDDPDSEFRNRTLDIALHEQIVKSPHLDKADSTRFAFRLKMLKKNPEGKKATNFSFVTRDGETMKLSDVKAGYTILWFYDPTCESCEYMIKRMTHNPDLPFLEEVLNVRLVLIYTGDDEQLWLKQAKTMPKKWLVGWDKTGAIEKDQLYDLSAKPLFFLLGKDKSVIMNDGKEDDFMVFLIRNAVEKDQKIHPERYKRDEQPPME